MRYIRIGTFTSLAATVAITLGMLLIAPSKAPATDLIEAMQNMNDAKSFQHTTKMTMDGKTMFEMNMYKLNNRMRFEVPDLLAFIIDEKENVLQLDFKAKTASRPTMAQLKAKNMKVSTQVEEFVKILTEMKGEGIKLIGEEKLGDVTAKVYTVTGIKVKDIPSDWKVWIDPKNKTPIRMEMTKGKADSSFVITSEFSKWNEKLDEKLFSLDVPEGYKLIEQK